ncbi:MAG TPA: Rpn family recombination-promoting nuclease/putative transposase [Polyangium sp.]|nr:Rpn family recombination-promoting nuclease/putative transposase [Polyangium sp.]
MRRRSLFADPKTDFTFHRIFGSEKHKMALIGFLNDIMSLDEEHRIVDVTFLDPTQRPKVEELKLSIVDVKCKDARGIHYVVEMQVLNVEAFDRRVVYNVAKAYTNQLDDGDGYPKLNDIVGITICDFEMWPQREGYQLPMVSRWKLQEQASGTVGLLALQFVFLELPKYEVQGDPQTTIEKWAYFFREARNLEMIPEALQYPPIVEALDAARTAAFTVDEWDAYIRAGMAIQNKRGMLSLAQKQGHKKGFDEGLKKGFKQGLEEVRKGGLRDGLVQAIRDICDLLAIPLSPERLSHMETLDLQGLELLRHQLKTTKSW